MKQKTYKVPGRIVEKLRKDFTDSLDVVNHHGLNYIERVSHSYHNAELDYDALATRFDQPLTWLDGSGLYMALVYHQLNLLSRTLGFGIPLWHCDYVISRLHNEVFFVPELQRYFEHLMIEGWKEHRDDVGRELPIYNWDRKDEISRIIMRSYDNAYHRYMTIHFRDKVINAL